VRTDKSPRLIANRDCAFLQQMLRQLVRDITMDLQKYLLAAAVHDADTRVLKRLSTERSAQVCDFITPTGLLISSGVIQESIMRLCTYFTEQAIHRSEHADVLGSSGIGAASLGERLGVLGN
jgi:hypothetical protein